jgi:hypothetical protein
MIGLLITIALSLPVVKDEIHYLTFKAEQKADHHVATYPKHPEIDDLDIFIDRKDRKENQIP